MPNYIERAQAYVPMLDEVYKLASCTSDMDGAQELVREGANAGELIIPMLEMDGLADYDRNEGYVGGSVSMRNATVKCNFERGRMFDVDALDNEETAVWRVSSSAPRSFPSWMPSVSHAMRANRGSAPQRAP